ncbi:MAG: VOC family protein [Actinomycetota bacterium]
MPEKTSHPHGSFSWADLATSDVEGATSFYTGLFDWDVEDLPIEPEGSYSMFRINGKDVAAASQGGPEQGPPHWNAYITVDDVDKTTEQAKELGANVLAEPFDVMGLGRMSIAQDPAGAAFCLWQGTTNIGAQLMDEVGSLTWFECGTSNMKAAEKFYTELFSWTTQPMGSEPPYTMFSRGDKQEAGFYELAGEMASIPPNWTVYFLVADCAASAEKAKELGGNLIVPPQDIPGFGKFSLIADPQGAAFGIYEAGRAQS